MSRTHRLGRSLPIAAVVALLVVGASFAHDSAPATTSDPSSTSAVGTGDDDRQIDGIVGTEWESADDQQGDEDDLAGKAEDDVEVGDQDENDDQDEADDQDDQGENEDQEEAKPAAPKVVSSHDGDEAEDNDDQGEDEDNDEAEDGEHDDGDHDGSDDGEHDDGGEHDGGDDGGDD